MLKMLPSHLPCIIEKKWLAYGYNKASTVMVFYIHYITIHKDPIWIVIYFDNTVRGKSLERFGNLVKLTKLGSSNIDA